jgi:dihydrofolate reductase
MGMKQGVPHLAPPRLALIAAVAKNGCIGLNNQLPWHLPEDLKHFKAITLGKAIIMGRNTFVSLGRPLPGRTNIVITRNPDFAAPEGVRITHSLKEAMAIARDVAQRHGQDEIVIIGGAQIYAESLPLVTRMYLTEVSAQVEGDAFFPTWNKAEWRQTVNEAHRAESTGLDYCFAVYERA